MWIHTHKLSQVWTARCKNVCKILGIVNSRGDCSTKARFKEKSGGIDHLFPSLWPPSLTEFQEAAGTQVNFGASVLHICWQVFFQWAWLRLPHCSKSFSLLTFWLVFILGSFLLWSSTIAYTCELGMQLSLSLTAIVSVLSCKTRALEETIVDSVQLV